MQSAFLQTAIPGQLLWRNKLKNSACIANEICSKLYKLKINAKNINDSYDNTTRFLIIGNSEIPESKNDKTTFVMTLENKSGSLIEDTANII